MKTVKRSFYRVTTADPHIARRKAILVKYPNIRGLMGPNQNSAVLIAALVMAQLFAAWWLCNQNWPAILLLANFIGAYAAASIYALIHDASHNLIFSNEAKNRLVAIHR